MSKRLIGRTGDAGRLLPAGQLGDPQARVYNPQRELGQLGNSATEMWTMQTAKRWLVVLCVTGLAAAFPAPGGGKAAGQDTGKKDKPADPKTEAADIGKDAPDFELKDCNGKTHKLSDYKDKLVVLEWLNKECPISRGAIPFMKDLRKKYADKGIVWLGIDSTYGRTAEDNQKYVKENELNIAVLLDGDGKVGKLYGAKTTPHMFVVNKGKLVYMGAHAEQQEKKDKPDVRNYVEEALSAVLAGKDVPVARTKSWGCAVKYSK